jgi:SAM-dependent methyltransferase
VTDPRQITDHDRRYWQYEYDVVQRTIIPLLGAWGIHLTGAAVLDAGCGEGGGVCAVHDAGARCAGFDVDSGRIELARKLNGGRAISFAVGSLYEAMLPFGESRYDLVILHDVFEHLDYKDRVLRELAGLLAPGGRILITFPPYFSAYGAHQQHLTAPYGRLPFIHLFPFALSQILPRMQGEYPTVVEEIQKLGRLKMGMQGFETIVARNGLRVEQRKAYLISPNHIRFGLRPLSAGVIGTIPLFREVLCTGVVYLVNAG